MKHFESLMCHLKPLLDSPLSFLWVNDLYRIEGAFAEHHQEICHDEKTPMVKQKQGNLRTGF